MTSTSISNKSEHANQTGPYKKGISIRFSQELLAQFHQLDLFYVYESSTFGIELDSKRYVSVLHPKRPFLVPYFNYTLYFNNNS